MIVTVSPFLLQVLRWAGLVRGTGCKGRVLHAGADFDGAGDNVSDALQFALALKVSSSLEFPNSKHINPIN